MSEQTPVTEHVHACVKILNEQMQSMTANAGTAAKLGRSLEAVFELVDMPWEGNEDPDWREGYETAVLDVVEHIAQVWGVTLPAPEWRLS